MGLNQLSACLIVLCGFGAAVARQYWTLCTNIDFPTEFNIAPQKKNENVSTIKKLPLDLRKPVLQSTPPISSYYYVNAGSDTDPLTMTVKKVPLASFRGSMLRTYNVLTPELFELETVSCEYDKNYVYILQSVATINDTCTRVNPPDLTRVAHLLDDRQISPPVFIKGKLIQGDLLNFPTWLHRYGEPRPKTLIHHTYLALPDFGTVTKVKVYPKAVPDLRRVAMQLAYSKMSHARKLLQCVYTPQKMYLIYDQPKIRLDKLLASREFKKTRLVHRLQLMIDLALILDELEYLGIVNMAIHPGNLYVGVDGRILLNSFNSAQPIGSLSPSRDLLKMDFPQWLEGTPITQGLDLFAVALTIVTIEACAQDKECDYFLSYPSRKYGASCYDSMDRKFCRNQAIVNVMNAMFLAGGSLNDKEENTQRINLTTAIVRILFGQDEAITHKDLRGFLVKTINQELIRITRRNRAAKEGPSKDKKSKKR